MTEKQQKYLTLADLGGRQENVALQALYSQKVSKIAEQKALSDKMIEILHSLNDSSKLTRKSLLAAIAVSKQPGYFEYYTPPEEVKNAEEGKTLNKLARQVSKVHGEIEALNAEIAQTSAKPPAKVNDIPLSGLSQWFELYGRPNENNHAATKDLLTAFVPSPKIYGGTSHHRSFKSTATIMRTGTLTR